ncbi:UvrD-helicase domain-containing protein [Roseateles chitinivorans]|uniref:UvrD-helicase domain-containing protein n=1 Tax=Roseateles chitinivorans TaxID=2917965 RepID=UPI003D66970C
MALPPRRIPAADWLPVGVDSLEPNALTVVHSSEHCSVLAGPGAGKTELLAQRAAFLLQTGASPPRSASWRSASSATPRAICPAACASAATRITRGALTP